MYVRTFIMQETLCFREIKCISFEEIFLLKCFINLLQLKTNILNKWKFMNKFRLPRFYQTNSRDIYQIIRQVI